MNKSNIFSQNHNRMYQRNGFSDWSEDEQFITRARLHLNISRQCELKTNIRFF